MSRRTVAFRKLVLQTSQSRTSDRGNLKPMEYREQSMPKGEDLNTALNRVCRLDGDYAMTDEKFVRIRRSLGGGK